MNITRVFNGAATIAATLDTTGQRIDRFDCLIAAVILSHGYTKILTNNVKDFNRIAGIEVFNYSNEIQIPKIAQSS